jgi:hypothetical protein
MDPNPDPDQDEDWELFVHLHHSSKIKSMVSSNFWSSGGSFSGAGKTRAKAWYYC